MYSSYNYFTIVGPTLQS